MGRTACTEPQCLYKGDLYLFTIYHSRKKLIKILYRMAWRSRVACIWMERPKHVAAFSFADGVMDYIIRWMVLIYQTTRWYSMGPVSRCVADM